MTPKLGGVRIRSGRYVRFENSHMQSISGSTYFSLTANAYRTLVKEPRAFGFDANIWGYKIGGTESTVVIESNPLTVAYTAVPSGS